MPPTTFSSHVCLTCRARASTPAGVVHRPSLFGPQPAHPVVDYDLAVRVLGGCARCDSPNHLTGDC